MTKRRFRTLVRLLMPLCFALACCGGRAAEQEGARRAPVQRPAVEEGCAKWPEIVNAAYQQVLGHPAPEDKSAETASKLAVGELSVRDLLKTLALSDEYREKFIKPLKPEEATRALYSRLLARDPSDAELKASASQVAGGGAGFAALVQKLLDSPAPAARPGGPPLVSSLRPCRLPLKLRREDAFDGGRTMTTEATVEADGKVSAATVVRIPSADKPFCGKVGLWLFDERGRVLTVIGPPKEQQWCVEGQQPGPQERVEEWQGTLPAGLAGTAHAFALLQRSANDDPQALTRENAERAAQIKRLVK